MYKKNNVITSIILLLCLCFNCLKLDAQNNIKDFLKKEAGEDKLWHTSGMFTTYRFGRNIYWEIPDSLMGRDMSLTMAILKAPALKDRVIKSKKFGYSGDLLGPVLLRLKREDNMICMIEPLCDRLVPDKVNDIFRIAEQRGNEMLHERFPVLVEGEQSVLINVTDLLLKNDFFNLNPYQFELGMGREDISKADITDIKGFSNNILLHFKRYFVLKDSEGDKSSILDEHITKWELGVSLNLLPKEPLKLRFRDDRVGFFGLRKTDFERYDHSLIKRMVVKRWRLEPKAEDIDRYLEGKLVDPQKPIVFFIDRQTPKRWVPYFKQAVESWNDAFERAGFKNAISARLAPSPEEDPDFSEYDSRHSFISWKTSPESNAYGPSFSDPRSGEILTTHVGVYSSVLDLLHKWYFAQCGVVDDRVCRIDVPDELMGSLLKMVVTHEIGHTLGLEHNFIASSVYSLKQIRDNDFLTKWGMGTSIMDYMRFNYVAGRSDNIDKDNLIAKIGAYDKFAIEWGYTYFPEKDLKQEQDYLRDWVGEQQKDSAKCFLDMIDIRVQSEDLGNDNVLFNTIGMENLKSLMEKKYLWQIKDVKSSHVIRSRYEAMILHHGQYIDHVLRHIGGQFRYGKECSDSLKFYYPQTKEYQKKAMVFLGKYMFEYPDWLYNKEVTSSLGIDLDDLISSFVSSKISALVRKFNSLSLSEDSYGKDIYTLNEYMDDLHSLMFKDLEHKGPAAAYYNKMRMEYVEQLQELLLQKYYSPSKVLVFAYNELLRIREESIENLNVLRDNNKSGNIEILIKDIELWMNKN